MYTNTTNVPEESAESILSFEADTENIPCIGSLTSLVPSQAPFLSGRELVLRPIQLLYLHILGYWLLNQIQHIHCTNRALVSIPLWAILLFLSLAMYIVTCASCTTGYPSGMVPGARPGLLLPDPDGRNNSVTRRPRHYVRRPPRLRRPPGRSLRSYRPPQDLPRDSSRLARVRVMHARIAPSGGGAGQRTTERAGCYPLRRWRSTRYQCAWLLARYLPKIPPKIPATGMVEAA
jgi:hypothetical protein